MIEEGKDFLDDFLHPGLSHAFRLEVAWEGFSTETKIALLKRLLWSLQKTDGSWMQAQYSIEWAKTVTRQAMEDNNAYVRYLGARMWPKGEDKEYFEHKINTDPSPLVQNLKLEDSLHDYVDDPQAFFALRPDQRLACLQVAEMVRVSIDDLVKIIDYATKPESAVPPEDICTLLLEVLTSDEFREEYIDVQTFSDGWDEHFYKEKLQSLWQLVPKLPDPAAELILRYVPTQVEGPDDCLIPDEVLDTLSREQFSLLFSRDNVKLPSLRRKYFLENLDEPRFGRPRLRGEACRYYFMLGIEEFGEILKKPAEIREAILSNIAMSKSIWLAPYFNLAACDGLLYSGNSNARFIYDVAIEIAPENLEICLEQFRQDEYEMALLRLYVLAKKMMPWEGDYMARYEKPIPEELAWLQAHVVEGDTWATFQNFSKFASPLRDSEALKKAVPFFDEKESQDTSGLSGAAQDDLKALISQVLDERFQDLEKTLAEACRHHENEMKLQNKSMADEIAALQEQLSEAKHHIEVSKTGKRRTQLMLFAVMAMGVYLWFYWMPANI